MNYAELESVLDGLAADVSFKRSFVGAYQQPDEATRRYTFRFEIFRPDRTLTADDINAFRATLVAHVEANAVRLL